VLVDERPGVDGRGREIFYNPSEVLSAVEESASHYLPAPDQRVLKAPRLRVRPLLERAVPIVATYSGSATPSEVSEAIEDLFYDAKGPGTTTDIASIQAAVLGLSGVVSFVIGQPTAADLAVGEYETAAMGGIVLGRV